MEYNINTKKDILTGDSKKSNLQPRTEKTKNMLISRHHNSGKNHRLKAANRSFENGKAKIFGNDTNK
jgi:hypothetical protein